MSTAAKQQKPEEQPTSGRESICVTVKDITGTLPPHERDVLKTNYQRDGSTLHSVWFNDTEAVRAVLRAHGLLKEAKA